VKLQRQFRARPAVTFFVKKIERNHLRGCPDEWIGSAPVRKITLLISIVCGCALAVSASAAKTENLTFKPQFVFTDRNGKTVSAPIVEEYQKNRIVHPIAKIDPRLDPKLTRAATIADERAHAHSKSRCWHYVKEALVASGVVTSRPTSSLAKQAGDELVRNFGFKKLPIRDPYAAPIGSVLVYFKGRNQPGHVEIRTKTGFVSDFRSKSACRYALLGVYVKR
jgi:hypothetical protein